MSIMFNSDVVCQLFPSSFLDSPQCGDICHDPAPCNVVAAFKSRTQQQQERFSNVADSAEEWLSQYSKRCPKCTVPIEKNRGCNHMSCTQCKHQFCWLCLAQWAPIRGCKCPQSAAELNRNALDQGHIEMTVRQAIGRVRTNGDRMKQSLLGHAGVRWLVSRCYSIVEHSHIVNMYLAQPVRTLEPKMTELLNDVEISLAPCARQTCDPSYTDCMMQLIANHIAELRVIVQGAAFNLLAPERPHEREMHNRDEDRDERLRLAHRRRRERNQAVHQAAVNGRRRHAIVEGMTERPYPAAPFGMPAQTNVFAPEEIDLFMQQLLGAEIQQHIPTAPEPPAPTWRRPMLFQPGPYPQPQPQPQHQPQPQPQPQLPAAPAPPLSRPPLSLAQQRAAQQWHEMQRYMHIMQSAPSVQAVQSMQAMQAAQEQMQRLENERQMRERQNEQWMQQFEDMLGTAMPVEPLLQLPQLQADVADLLQEPVAPVEPFVGLPAPYMPEWAEFADAEEVVIPETPLPIRRRGRPPGAKNRPKPQEPVVVPPTVPPTVRSRVHHWPGPFTADHIPATTATTATAIPTRTSDAGLSHASAAPTVAARSTSTTDLLQSIQQHRPATMTLPQRPFFETGAALLGGSDVTTEPRSVVGFGKRRYEESTPAAVSPATTSPIPSTFITPPTTSTDIPAPWATMCLLDTDQLHEELADDAVRYRARRAVSPEVTITRVSYPTSATPSTAELAFPPPTSTPAAAVDDMMETSWWWDNWTM
eukprot:TRINITY_DN1484_c0_g2_i3.p1 TRINITY_DN1484_c0_g2~~TRINITY_DN1484_c0_g2_i3.p1  ORF type:complete len:757 (-),score=166.82 TRINITY_DN1484_c0_g2_i3:1507-3777(-)